jgi:hypothetical protein
MPHDRATQIQRFISLLDEYIGFITDLPANADFDGHFRLEEQINAKAATIGFKPLFVREDVWRDSKGALAGGVEKRMDDIDAAVMEGRTHPAIADRQLAELEQQYRAVLDLRVHRPHDMGFTIYNSLPIQRFTQRERAELIVALREWQRAARTSLLDCGQDPEQRNSDTGLPSSPKRAAPSADAGAVGQAGTSKQAHTKGWLTVSKAATKSKINKGEISRACDSGAMHSIGKGRKRRLDPASFKVWEQNRKRGIERRAAMTLPPPTAPKPQISSGLCRQCSETVTLTDGQGKCPKCGSTKFEALARNVAQLRRSAT